MKLIASVLHTLSHHALLLFSTWQCSNNVLLSPLPGQFVLPGRTDIRLRSGDRDPHPVAVAVQSAFVGRVVDVRGRRCALLLLALFLTSVQQHTHFQEVFGAPSTNLCGKMWREETELTNSFKWALMPRGLVLYGFYHSTETKKHFRGPKQKMGFISTKKIPTNARWAKKF